MFLLYLGTSNVLVYLEQALFLLYLGTNKFLTKIYSELKACEICMKTTYRTKVIFFSRKKTFEQSERKVSVNKSNNGRFSAQSIIDMRIN